MSSFKIIVHCLCKNILNARSHNQTLNRMSTELYLQTPIIALLQTNFLLSTYLTSTVWYLHVMLFKYLLGNNLIKYEFISPRCNFS